MNADDFRVGVFHGNEDIGSAFPDGDRLRHVRSPHFIDLVGDDRPMLAAVRMRGFPADDDRTRAQIRDRPHGRETVVHHCGGRAVTMGLVAFGQGGRPNPSLRLVFRR
jgi:hypothetical protein